MMTLPSLPHLGLALAIVKSKPADQHMRDFVDSLRQSVGSRTGSPELRLESDDYWRHESNRLRDQLDEANAACGRALADKRTLELELETQAVPSASRRKRQSDTTAPNSRAKRARTTRSCEQSTNPRSTSLDDLLVSTTGVAGANISSVAGLTYYLHDLLQQPNGSATVLLPILARLSASLCSLFGLGQSRQHDESLLAQAQHSEANRAQLTVRGFQVALSAYDNLDVLGAASSSRSSATYQLVSIFNSILGHAVRPIARTESMPKPAFGTNPHLGPLKVDEVNFGLLAAMFKLLDPNKRHHLALYEGFMYHLLHQLGTLLSSAVFQYDPSHTEITTPCPHLDSPDTHWIALRLVQVLKVALHRAPRDYISSSSRASNQRSNTRSNTVGQSGASLSSQYPSCSLLSRITDKLQRTLVKATLKDIAIFDDAAEILKEPLPPETTYAAAQPARRPRSSRGKKAAVEVEDPVAKYKVELWDCLGWDILGREGRLADMFTDMD